TENASGSARTTTFGYDAGGRSQTITRPNGVVTTTTYDPNQGAVASLSHKQGGITELSPWSYTHSAAGRISAETTTGRSRSFTYDGAGRLTVSDENSGATIRNYAYDANTNRCANSTSCAVPSYTYDNADRVTASPYATAYSYDSRGNVIATTGTGGNPSTSLAYDANDHAILINDGTNTASETLAPSGRVLRRVVIANATGTVSEDTSYGYDGPGDNPTYHIPTPASWGWPILLADDLTASNGSVWAPSKWTTTSNDSTRIADIQSNEGRLYVNGSAARATAKMPAVADGDVTFTYRFDNRTSRSYLRPMVRASGASGSSQMTTGYRVELRSDSASIKLQSYVSGTATEIGSFTYTMDTNTQRLRIQVIGNAVKVKAWPVGTSEPGTWQINVTNTAVTGTGVFQINHNYSSGAHTVFVDDVSVKTPAPTVPASVKTYISGPMGVLVIDENGTPSYPLANGHGDIVGTTNTTGVFTSSPTTDEFGRGSTPTTRLGWLGTHERFTVATGIMRMGVRLYEPNLGRFLSVDSVEGGSSNDYEYGAGDPVNNTDLSGTRIDDFGLYWFSWQWDTLPGPVHWYNDWVWYRSIPYATTRGAGALQWRDGRVRFRIWELGWVTYPHLAFARVKEYTVNYRQARLCSASWGMWGYHNCTTWNPTVMSVSTRIVSDLWTWDGRFGWRHNGYPGRKS
ncbi:MAG: RHS repeat-associated core domain-containing protein, partial [Acidimicrobiia bacterium]